MSRVLSSDIVAAYQRTGSVWRAGKELGLSGQTVHERLRLLGHPMLGREWSEDELTELRSLVGHMTLGEIAHRLGRPYAGVAAKVSRLGLAGHSYPRSTKIPRGAGYDKVSVKRYVRQLQESGEKITRFARRNGLGIEGLCQAIERHEPEFWLSYRRSQSDIAEKPCPYCNRSFIPGNSKQVYCTRQCANTSRQDTAYFGGNRRNTIGLAEGQCQLCGRVGIKGLSSHHVLGKENDPENEALIALCRGCHKLVTLLATRTFVDDPQVWESLIQLVWIRNHGGEGGGGVYCYVEIEPLTAEEMAEEMEGESP